MRKILIVEDDKLIADLERDYLEVDGYEVETAYDGYEGIKLAKTKDYDLVLLDVMLPGISGFEICREIRKSKSLPIILVTARKTDVDKVRGLLLGADDYIVKPFSPTELVARVRAHIQIHERLLSESSGTKSAEESIAVKNLKILPPSRRVFVGENEIVLTNKEFELLQFLASNPNIVFSKETLFDRIWGIEAFGDLATVTVHVKRLRDKLEKEDPEFEYIETIWGTGYRFTI